MSETYLPPDGVRVRVVLEGPVSNSREGSFSVGVGNRRNVIYPGSDHVVSIEKKARVWCVGDVVRGTDYGDAAGIPIGTMVVPRPGGGESTAVKTSTHEWVEIGAGRAIVHHSIEFIQPRTIVYIPS